MVIVGVLVLVGASVIARDKDVMDQTTYV